MGKITILTTAVWYLPAYERGGSVLSIANMVNSLSDSFVFKIITMGCNSEGRPYPLINLNSWNRVGNADVYYFSTFSRAWSGMRSLIMQTEHDILYLNSFFQPLFSAYPLLLRKLRIIDRKPVVIAPRGEFSLGALQIKPRKKNIFISAVSNMGLYDNLLWQASSAIEEQDIQNALPGEHGIRVAADLSSWNEETLNCKYQRAKSSGKLRIVFLSRICRMKNLIGALRILMLVQGDYELDVYGPLEDMEYWQECQKIMAQLPSNVFVKYCGEVEHDSVYQTFSQYHLFLFPTLGENFGHVVLEALLSGCPVLVSDRTPWTDLQGKAAGWIYHIEDQNAAQRVIEKVCAMDSAEFGQLSSNAKAYGQAYINNASILDENRRLFLDALIEEKCKDG